MKKISKWFASGITPAQVLEAVVAIVIVAFVTSIKLEITLCDGCGKLLIKTISSIIGYHEN